MQTDTHFLAFWRALNAWRADLGLAPLNLGEVVAFRRVIRA